MKNEHIIVSVSDGVLELALARPRKKNALSAAMYDVLRTQLEQAVDNPDIRVVLLRGGSDVFCAGNDIEGFSAIRELPLAQRPGYRFMQALATFPKPVVAAVSGAAIGIGATLLLHCDLVYASSDARFRMPFVDVGLVPEFASSLLLPRMAGHAKAAALLLLGETFSAPHAHAIGLVGEVVEPETLFSRAEQAARRLAAKPGAALQASKRLLKQPLQEVILQTIEREMQALNHQLEQTETQQILAGVLNSR